jgi:hypothetical protein
MNPSNHQNSMQFLVSAHEPHCIIWSAHQGHILGYSREEVCGRSVLILCGPCTDSLRFFTAISQASVLKTSHIPLKLRDKDGSHRCYIASCSPAVDCAGQLKGCLISLVRTEQTSEQPSMKISSSPVNDFFTKQDKKQCTTNDCFKTSPSIVKKRGRTRSTDNCRSIAISQLISKPTHEVSIMPRQRCGRFPQSRQPVKITLDVLHTLRHCSMAQVAEALGLSLAALKKACKQLGAECPALQRAPRRLAIAQGCAPEHEASGTPMTCAPPHVVSNAV